MNKAIGYFGMHDYHKAASLFLQVLKQLPEASHIWGYLKSAFASLQRSDLVDLAAAKDVTLFINEFEF